MRVCAVASLWLLLGCGEGSPRALTVWSRPGPDQVLFESQVTGPRPHGTLAASVAGGRPDEAAGQTGARVRIACATCHAAGDHPSLASRKDAPGPHTGLRVEHGALPCTACHDRETPSRLHSAASQEIALADSMQLCAQCHGLVKRAYDHGAHGGMRGYWDRQRGPRQRNDCITCHDPHQPAYPLVTPVAGPKERRAHPRRHPGSLVEQRYGGSEHE